MESTPGHLRVQGRLDGERAAFTLEGSVDLSSGQAVRDAVCEALDAGAREVVLDLAPVSFLIGNFKTGENELLAKNAAGYDQELQVKSWQGAFEVFEALKNWEERP